MIRCSAILVQSLSGNSVLATSIVSRFLPLLPSRLIIRRVSKKTRDGRFENFQARAIAPQYRDLSSRLCLPWMRLR
jgi:hypothetical protein